MILLDFLIRINRNIVECKVCKRFKLFTPGSCINRNIVECKVVTLLSIFYHRSVLIETLWNVKAIYGETIPFSGFSINRNIVECKVVMHFSSCRNDAY